LSKSASRLAVFSLPPGDVGGVLVARILGIVDGDQPGGVQPVPDAEKQLDVVDDVGTADHGDPPAGQQQRGEMLGHVDAVVEVRVDHRRVDREPGAFQADDGHALLPGIADRTGGGGRVDYPDHDGVIARVGAGPDVAVRLLAPVRLVEVGVGDP
jgi:hypothetical protein